jgi:hypothetical protein
MLRLSLNSALSFRVNTPSIGEDSSPKTRDLAVHGEAGAPHGREACRLVGEEGDAAAGVGVAVAGGDADGVGGVEGVAQVAGQRRRRVVGRGQHGALQ